MSNQTIKYQMDNNIFRKPFLPELFSEVCTLKNNSDKIALLRQFMEYSKENKLVLEAYIWQLLNPDANLELPSEIPPFRQNDVELVEYAQLNMLRAVQRVVYFNQSFPEFIENQVKREAFFIKTLEELHPLDAELYAQFVLKTFKLDRYKGLTDKIFIEAFPNLFPEGYIQETKK